MQSADELGHGKVAGLHPMLPGVLPLPAIRCLIRHIDAVDRVLSRRLTNKRPATEPALTEALGRMLDEEEQKEFRLDYTIEDLNTDLSGPAGTCSVRISLETHQYAKGMENKVTQSDLGVVFRYEDQIDPQHSFERGALLQAKRLYPVRKTGTPSAPEYNEACKFSAATGKQDDRIKKLRDTFGDFISRLLFCPRPDDLPSVLQKKLAHLRDHATTGRIFDFALGLELRDDLLAGSPTTAAGVWVAKDTPGCFGEVHAGAFRGTTPFSWWVLERILGGQTASFAHPGEFPTEATFSVTSEPLNLGLIRGEQDCLDEILARLDIGGEPSFQLFPAHTVTIEVGVAAGIDEHEARLDMPRQAP